MADREEISRLAALRPVDYAVERIAAALALGVSPRALDAEIKLIHTEAKAVAKAARDAAKPQNQHINGHGFDRTTDLVPATSSAPEPDRSPEFSDDHLALEFADRHKGQIRYTAIFGRWSQWTGQFWQSDDTMETFTLARKVCRDAAQIADGRDKDKEARMIASAKTVAAVVNLGRSDRRLAATKDQWDADPWELNTTTGIVNLKTCERTPHRPAAYCTAICSTGPSDDTQNCDLWLEFLDRIMGGNQALISFLQRVAGYCLTGVTSEHAIFFLYGSGANGKSVFISTIAGIMADYQRVAPIEVFMESKNDRHPTELAMLNGARLVTATETEEGRRWNESKLKALTGGDKITAHFMRQDFFEFTPRFKLVIAGNHRPSLRSVDEAIRRRMNLIPFAVTIPPGERDPDLSKKLEAERAGILAWMLAGCAEWQRIGLCPPAEVKEATERYLSNEDVMAAWIEECCTKSYDAFETGAKLFKSFKRWCEKNGEHCGQKKQFNEKIVSYGAEEKRTNSGRGFIGLNIKVYDDEGQTYQHDE